MDKVTIKTAYVHFAGDPSVGISSFGHEINLFLETADPDEIEYAREAISECYEKLEGEKPNWVQFDFEQMQEALMEIQMDAEREEYEKLNDIEEDRQLAAELNAEKEMQLQVEDILHEDFGWMHRHNERAIRNYI